MMDPDNTQMREELDALCDQLMQIEVYKGQDSGTTRFEHVANVFEYIESDTVKDLQEMR